MKKTALLLIDAQVNMFVPSTMVYQGDALLETLGSMIRRARQAGVPVFYVQHNGQAGDPDETGTAGWQIHPALTPRTREMVFQKRTPSSFYGTSLDEVLQRKGVERLVILGLQTEFCIDTTVRHAYALGYEVLLVQDGHSTYNGKVLTAPQIIAHHNDILGCFADVVEAGDIEF
jgi:nicotinamidase-related amidase